MAEANPLEGEVIVEVQRLRHACIAELSSPIAQRISFISDLGLQIIVATTWETGLAKWSPDVFGLHSSVYNLTHQELALQTFQHLALNTDAYL